MTGLSWALMSERHGTNGPAGEVRQATAEDAPVIGELLHRFNTEYEDATPGPEAVAARMSELIEAGDSAVLLAEPGPAGIAVLRFRPAIWSSGLESYLAELYVVPDRRGQGLGRALLEEGLALARARGADQIGLDTSDDDVAARALYESLGFSNNEGAPDGPSMRHYEREL